MDKQNTAFVELRGTCEHLARELRQDGVGAKVKHTPIITLEVVDQLWKSGAIVPPRFLFAVFSTMLAKSSACAVDRSKGT